MATDISDLDALKKYLEEKNLTLQTCQEAGSHAQLPAPHQWTPAGSDAAGAGLM